MNSRTLARPLAAVVLASTLVLGATPAWATTHSKPHGGGGGGGVSSTTGIDVSYPQCASSLPAGRAFTVVGVNGGLANNYNKCLSTEFAYALKSTGLTKQSPAQLYLNTGDAGNGVADWPSPNQLGAYGRATTPSGATCDFQTGSSGAGANSPACAYIYGYDMVAGIAYSGGNIPGDLASFKSATGSSLYSYPVWLDVETGNSWQSGTNGLAMNVADLQGMVDALNAAAQTATSAPAKQIGIYSTSYQWGQITGTPSGAAAGNLQNLPDWVPGATGQSGAASNCSLAPFTAGGITITQWTGTFDNDYSCIG